MARTGTLILYLKKRGGGAKEKKKDKAKEISTFDPLKEPDKGTNRHMNVVVS